MPDYKECPYCSEQIEADATYCVHCDSELEQDPVAEKPQAKEPESPQETTQQELPPQPPRQPEQPAGMPPQPPSQPSKPPQPPQPPSGSPQPPQPGQPSGMPPQPPQQAQQPPGMPQPPAGQVPPAPGSGPASYQGAPGAQQQAGGGGFSFSIFTYSIIDLFSGEDFSASRLARIDLGISAIILGAVSILGPLFVMLVAWIEFSGPSGVFGWVFRSFFLAGTFSNLLSYGALVVLLIAWLEFKKAKYPTSAHFSLTTMIAIIFFAVAVLESIIRFLPWSEIGAVMVALVVFRFSFDTLRNKSILEPLAVLSAWFVIQMLIIGNLIRAIFF